MKAIIYQDFGHPKEVLKIEEIPKPKPKENQVLIQVKASSLSLYDYQRFVEPVEGKEVSELTKYMDTKFSNMLGKTLGIEISGIIEEVGNKVEGLKKGDEVYAVGNDLVGGWAEFALSNVGEVYLKPSNLSFEEAAAVPSTAITALGALQLANLDKGQHVLIIGATGGVGQFAVQIAKAKGLVVTGVCSSRNVDLVKKLGADFVIDYNNEDLVNLNKRYDGILGISGYQTLEEYKNLLNPEGIYIPLKTELLLQAQKENGEIFNGNRKIIPFYYPMMEDKGLPYLKELIESGQITIVVDRTYSVNNLSQAIVDSIESHPRGKVVISMDF